VIVTVVAVGTVQVISHEIVRVIAVRHRLVSARAAVMVIRRVARVKARRTRHRVLSAHADRVVHDARAFLVLEMAVSQVVDVTLMPHCPVSARGTMDVLLSWGRHRCRSSG
jgi:hypothetical protein